MAVQKSGSEACRIPLLYHLIAGFRQSGGDDLRHVEQLRGGLRKRPERVAEHGLAERTRRTDHRGPGAGEFPGALDIHALPSSSPRNIIPPPAPQQKLRWRERRGSDDLIGVASDDLARLVVNPAVPAQVARVVVDNLAQPVRRRQPLL